MNAEFYFIKKIHNRHQYNTYGGRTYVMNKPDVGSINKKQTQDPFDIPAPTDDPFLHNWVVRKHNSVMKILQVIKKQN